MNKKDKIAFRKTADEFIQTVKERVAMLVLTEDIDGLGRLVSQVDILSGYEVIKALRDKGLSKEITALADKAGRITLKGDKHE